MASNSPSDPPERLPAFRLTGSLGGRLPPVVLSSPHSGRHYPSAFLARTRLAMSQLRRAEDAYVDELLQGAAALGVPLLAATYGRAYLDLNRDPQELDPSLFAEPLPPHPAQSSERVTSGLGVLPRLVGQGLEIYAGQLHRAEADARIAAVHQPYHRMLTALLERARARHGHVLLLDCHSMPSLPPGPSGSPQFVLGDLHGRSASPSLVDPIEDVLTQAGYRVARNAPYAGGYTTAHHAAPLRGIHVVQIEIDRALYMEPLRLMRHGGFVRITKLMTDLVRTLLARMPSLGLEPAQRMAAE